MDILAVKPGSPTAFIIDPTVRWESNGNVAAEVQSDKERIYTSCIPDLKKRYKEIGNKNCEVIGVWLGARGTICRQLVALFDRFGFDRKILPELAESVLVDSVHIIHHHIYGP